MARITKIMSMGLPLDANLLPNIAPGNANQYYATDDQLIGVDQAAWGGINGLDTRLDAAELDIIGLENNDAYFASIIAGYSAFFTGEYSFTGTPNNVYVSAFSNVNSSQIDYNAGWFNFPYLGTYYAFVELQGNCVNVRADWYQEVTLKLAKSGVERFGCLARIPPSGTFNMMSAGWIPFDVQSGDQWKLKINMTTNGSTTDGKALIKIYKKF